MSIDWKVAYDAFDGSMPECRGADCSCACCATKITPTWDQGRQAYNTTMDPEELRFHEDHFGPLADLGIDARTFDVSTDRRANLKALISGCLAEDGGCKLQNRKPIACRVFPFRMTSFAPIIPGKCPSARHIGTNQTVVSGLMQIRAALGMGDTNVDWEQSLKEILDRC